MAGTEAVKPTIAQAVVEVANVVMLAICGEGRTQRAKCCHKGHETQNRILPKTTSFQLEHQR